MASNIIFKKSGLLKAMSRRVLAGFTLAAVSGIVGTTTIFAQEPKPGPSRQVVIPAVKETKLKNGLTVASVQKSNVPLVTVQVLIKTGANVEGESNAGLANLTSSLLSKGTKNRTAVQIAEEIGFLGGSISSNAGWNSSSVTISVTKDKLTEAMAILSDVVLHPTFPNDEIELLRTQSLDDLTYGLTQPGFLSSYVSSKFTYGEHPVGGTPQSIASITRERVLNHYKTNFVPSNAVIIYTGDITAANATKISRTLFGQWRSDISKNTESGRTDIKKGDDSNSQRVLVVDLPGSGQASVSYAKRLNFGRTEYKSPLKGASSSSYFPSSVLNSVLGGGYSSRLNQEIRIKRGLSYGAGSSIAWRPSFANFSTRTQTKNESAAEVAELVMLELTKLRQENISDSELVPRKLALTGGFGRDIETNGGLLGAIADLYSSDIPASELNRYMTNVEAVKVIAIQNVAKDLVSNGDIIIVGDYAKFKDDLARRFPNIKPEVISAAELDITKPNLRK